MSLHKDWGKQLIAPDCFASTCSSLMVPSLHPHVAVGTITGQGTQGGSFSCSEALLCSGELQHNNPYALPRNFSMWIFWRGNICDSTVCLIKTLLCPIIFTSLHALKRKREMFIHMHITILPKAIKCAEIWKGHLAEERLVHNTALVCWYLEQTQFCPAKHSMLKICIWVVGLKLPSNFRCSSSLRKIK